MVGYSNISAVKDWHSQQVINEVINNLQRRNFAARYCLSKDACNEYLKKSIGLTDIVSCGGSVTLEQLGIIEELEQRGNKTCHSFHAGLSKEQQFDAMRQGMMADVFMSSANAVTKDGKLYFVDGIGNRVSSIVFGPKRTIIVVGNNKIVDSLDDAFNRVRSKAAPMNIRRYFKEGSTIPPCAVAGKCCDCSAPLRACNIRMILEAKPSAIDFEVIIVNEQLGF